MALATVALAMAMSVPKGSSPSMHSRKMNPTKTTTVPAGSLPPQCAQSRS